MVILNQESEKFKVRIYAQMAYKNPGMPSPIIIPGQPFYAQVVIAAFSSAIPEFQSRWFTFEPGVPFANPLLELTRLPGEYDSWKLLASPVTYTFEQDYRLFCINPNIKMRNSQLVPNVDATASDVAHKRITLQFLVTQINGAVDPEISSFPGSYLDRDLDALIEGVVGRDIVSNSSWNMVTVTYSINEIIEQIKTLRQKVGELQLIGEGLARKRAQLTALLSQEGKWLWALLDRILPSNTGIVAESVIRRITSRAAELLNAATVIYQAVLPTPPDELPPNEVKKWQEIFSRIETLSQPNLRVAVESPNPNLKIFFGKVKRARQREKPMFETVLERNESEPVAAEERDAGTPAAAGEGTASPGGNGEEMIALKVRESGLELLTTGKGTVPADRKGVRGKRQSGEAAEGGNGSSVEPGEEGQSEEALP